MWIFYEVWQGYQDELKNRVTFWCIGSDVRKFKNLSEFSKYISQSEYTIRNIKILQDVEESE